jgi:hypothetical protein
MSPRSELLAAEPGGWQQHGMAFGRAALLSW